MNSSETFVSLAMRLGPFVESSFITIHAEYLAVGELVATRAADTMSFPPALSLFASTGEDQFLIASHNIMFVCPAPAFAPVSSPLPCLLQNLVSKRHGDTSLWLASRVHHAAPPAGKKIAVRGALNRERAILFLLHCQRCYRLPFSST
jgi:hypothetical protein